MRNNIISLQKYSYLSAVWLQFGQKPTEEKTLCALDFAQSVDKQLILDRYKYKQKLRKYYFSWDH